MASWELSRPDTVTVGTSSVEISPIRSAQNPRSVIYLKNISTSGQVITVAFSVTPAVANKGFVLNPGEYIIESVSEKYEPWQGSIQAISSGATGSLALYERQA